MNRLLYESHILIGIKCQKNQILEQDILTNCIIQIKTMKFSENQMQENLRKCITGDILHCDLIL